VKIKPGFFLSTHTRSRDRLRRAVFITLTVAVLLGSAACYQIGSFLYAEDPLDKADAIFVLAGTRMERPLEAADLYLEGYAPQIVLTHDTPDGGIVVLERRGLVFPREADLARDTIVRLGVPGGALLVLTQIHDNTAQEAHTLRELALARGWRRVIVVTSKFHTRRAGFAMRRELKGTGVEVRMRGTRYDRADPAHWWRSRGDMRWIALETQKLIAYALGLAM
jgi:uncharacterized SAM-binding protein YcdF (DUF218 family)